MGAIDSELSLHQWLSSKPDDFARVVAIRSALRTLPYGLNRRTQAVGSVDPELALFRCLALSWSTLLWRSDDFLWGVERAADGAIDNLFAEPAAHDAAFSAAEAITSANTESIIKAAVNSVQRSAHLVGWGSSSNDCEWLEKHKNPIHAPEELAKSSLWLGSTPLKWTDLWVERSRKLFYSDTSFQVWIGWFENRIRGDDSAFLIHGDKFHQEDRGIILALCRASDQDFWDRGAKYVNSTLDRWLDRAQRRVAPSELATNNPEAVSAKLLETASPQARVVDGKLDAVPNALFDTPQYSDNLADLPSEMRAFLAVIEQSLPRNCPLIMRNCIKGYAEELMVRGNRPIVNILTGMASSIAAQFWVVGEGSDPNNPATWQARHPEEWDSGTVDLLRTFFKKHIDLINHFPLNVEREELIAAIPIDEMRASGAALLDPIQAVNELIIGLNQNGLATDNIVRIMDAHLRYARDISGLPAPDQANSGGARVTPKHRFVLNSAGFYLHAYSILGTTVSLAESKQVAALMVQLYAAAQVLLGFIL